MDNLRFAESVTYADGHAALYVSPNRAPEIEIDTLFREFEFVYGAAKPMSRIRIAFRNSDCWEFPLFAIFERNNVYVSDFSNACQVRGALTLPECPITAPMGMLYLNQEHAFSERAILNRYKHGGIYAFHVWNRRTRRIETWGTPYGETDRAFSLEFVSSARDFEHEGIMA